MGWLGDLVESIFNPIWKRLGINLADHTFSLKVTEKKKQWLIHGKLATHEPCMIGFAYADDVLTLKCNGDTANIPEIVQKFEQVLSGEVE